jgi:hypothetical protein
MAHTVELQAPIPRTGQSTKNATHLIKVAVEQRSGFGPRVRHSPTIDRLVVRLPVLCPISSRGSNLAPVTAILISGAVFNVIAQFGDRTEAQRSLRQLSFDRSV